MSHVDPVAARGVAKACFEDIIRNCSLIESIRSAIFGLVIPWIPSPKMLFPCFDTYIGASNPTCFSVVSSSSLRSNMKSCGVHLFVCLFVVCSVCLPQGEAFKLKKLKKAALAAMMMKAAKPAQPEPPMMDMVMMDGKEGLLSILSSMFPSFSQFSNSISSDALILLRMEHNFFQK